jgi:periplasmic copper chaperone A
MHLPAVFRPVSAAVLAVGVALAVPGAAYAHVAVSSDHAVQGGYAKLVFRVPNESDTASTTRLVITLPKDTPIPSIRTKPKPGWTATVTREKLAQPVKTGDATLTEAPATVTFTAANPVAIGPGQFDEFELSGGPLPSSARQLTLPAAQYYSDGTVVNWNQPTADGKAEPEHPAPVLVLAAAPGSEHSGTQTSGTQTSGTQTSGTRTSGAEDAPARGLAVAALVVALVAAVLGALALRRRTSA